MASATTPVDRSAGRMYGPALGLSKSRTIVFRLLRTRYSTGCVSTIRTREAGAPSASTGSTFTTAIGLVTCADTELARPSAPTLRKSTNTVSGSVASVHDVGLFIGPFHHGDVRAFALHDSAHRDLRDDHPRRAVAFFHDGRLAACPEEIDERVATPLRLVGVRLDRCLGRRL